MVELSETSESLQIFVTGTRKKTRLNKVVRMGWEGLLMVGRKNYISGDDGQGRAWGKT